MTSIILKIFRLTRGNSSKSWIYTSGLMLVFRVIRKLFTKKEIVDLSASKPGDKFVVEHLPITHRKQIKEMKKSKKEVKRSKKVTRKQRRLARKTKI